MRVERFTLPIVFVLLVLVFGSLVAAGLPLVLGAASVLYGSRIIIFRDSRVELASNFKDIGYITFEADNLTAKMVELFRELISFGLIKLSIAS